MGLMGNQELEAYYTQEEQSITIWLNRPARKNAMDRAMADLMPAIVSEVSVLPQSVVLIRGQGGYFSAGGDLGFLQERLEKGMEENRTAMLLYYRSFLSILDLPQMTVACVEGGCYGAALALALACDQRLIERECRLALNFVRLGISPGMGAVPLAYRWLRQDYANRLLMTGSVDSAENFCAAGGGTLVTGGDGMQREIDCLITAMQSVSPLALRRLKEETRRKECLEAELIPFLELEAQSQAICFRDGFFAEKIGSATRKD